VQLQLLAGAESGRASGSCRRSKGRRPAAATARDGVPTRETCCVDRDPRRSPYANSSTQAAVLRPTPRQRPRGNRGPRRAAPPRASPGRARGRVEPTKRGLSEIACRIALDASRLDPSRMPPGGSPPRPRPTGASRQPAPTAAARSRQGADRRRPRLRSLVDCESNGQESAPRSDGRGGAIKRDAVDVPAAVRAAARHDRRRGGVSRARSPFTGSPVIHPPRPPAPISPPVPDVSDHSGEIDGLPVFWRSAPVCRAEGKARRPLYLHGVPTSLRRVVARSSRAPAVLAPDLPGFGRSGQARPRGRTRSTEYDRFIEGLPSITFSRGAREHGRARLGRASAWAFARSDARSGSSGWVIINFGSVPARLPLAPDRAQCGGRRGLGTSLGDGARRPASRCGCSRRESNATPGPDAPRSGSTPCLAHFDQGTQRPRSCGCTAARHPPGARAGRQRAPVA